MKVIIFGSTGMIGQGVLLECLEDPDVQSVLLINRRTINNKHPKIREIILEDLTAVNTISHEFAGYNACFNSLGVTVIGKTEQEYTQITYDLGVTIAMAVLDRTTDLTYCYISGANTDSTEKGRTMWARVKGRLENKLLSMPFKSAYMFRPGYIQPLKGIKSRTGWYNTIYFFLKPLYFLFKPMSSLVTDSVSLAKAMLFVARYGYEKKILENKDINKLGRS